MGGDLDRVCAKPPVHEVEVMRGFVNPETAASVLQSMPAAEVVCSVNDVQVPAEIDRE